MSVNIAAPHSLAFSLTRVPFCAEFSARVRAVGVKQRHYGTLLWPPIGAASDVNAEEESKQSARYARSVWEHGKQNSSNYWTHRH